MRQHFKDALIALAAFILFALPVVWLMWMLGFDISPTPDPHHVRLTVLVAAFGVGWFVKLMIDRVLQRLDKIDSRIAKLESLRNG